MKKYNFNLDEGTQDFPNCFCQLSLKKTTKRYGCLARKNISDQAKVLLSLFSIFDHKLENFYYSFLKDLDKHFKKHLNELFLLETDYTQVKDKIFNFLKTRIQQICNENSDNSSQELHDEGPVILLVNSSRGVD